MLLPFDSQIAITLAVLASICVSSLPASAQHSSATDAEAHGLFDAATAAFDDGRLDDAYGYFTRAYELSGRAELLFNIASTCERLRRDREAIEYYERYLASVPDADNRRFVEGRLNFLRAAVLRASDEAAAADDVRIPATDPAHTPVASNPARLAPSETALSSAVEPSTAGSAQRATLDVEPRPNHRRRRVIVWTTVAVVLAGAVGAGVGVALHDPGVDGPIAGDVGPGGILVALVRAAGAR